MPRTHATLEWLCSCHENLPKRGSRSCMLVVSGERHVKMMSEFWFGAGAGWVIGRGWMGYVCQGRLVDPSASKSRSAGEASWRFESTICTQRVPKLMQSGPHEDAPPKSENVAPARAGAFSGRRERVPKMVIWGGRCPRALVLQCHSDLQVRSLRWQATGVSSEGGGGGWCLEGGWGSGPSSLPPRTPP